MDIRTPSEREAGQVSTAYCQGFIRKPFSGAEGKVLATIKGNTPAFSVYRPRYILISRGNGVVVNHRPDFCGQCVLHELRGHFLTHTTRYYLPGNNDYICKRLREKWS